MSDSNFSNRSANFENFISHNIGKIIEDHYLHTTDQSFTKKAEQRHRKALCSLWRHSAREFTSDAYKTIGFTALFTTIANILVDPFVAGNAGLTSAVLAGIFLSGAGLTYIVHKADQVRKLGYQYNASANFRFQKNAPEHPQVYRRAQELADVYCGGVKLGLEHHQLF